jgi:ribose 1,5-bisphosphokinase
MLAARLAARGREPSSQHQARLSRPELSEISRTPLLYISNDRTPLEGAEALLVMLRQCVPPAPRSLPAIPAQPATRS